MKELQTERLRLRRLRREDAPRVFEYWASDPEVTKYLTWQPHATVAVTEAVMDHWLAEYERTDCCRYGIELKGSGELIGMIDVVNIEDGIPEIGYCSGRPTWGHGYMTEALKAVCAMLFDAGYPSIRIRAERENIGSNRVIRKAGFRYVKSYEDRRGRDKPEIVTICSYILERV